MRQVRIQEEAGQMRWTSLRFSGWRATGVNWGLIEGGDSIYVSGGTDSTVYKPQTLRGRIDTNPSGAGLTFNQPVL